MHNYATFPEIVLDQTSFELPYFIPAILAVLVFEHCALQDRRAPSVSAVLYMRCTALVN